MTVLSPVLRTTDKEVWLRRGASSHPYAPGQKHYLSLSELGIAAARETFVTATLPFAAAWTDLFRSMIAHGHELRWRENGPGIGRDARVAYSSLLGRYMARAYLTANEGVRYLVPLDTARRAFRGTSFRLGQSPPGQALEADWIGLDHHQRLVIAEAKGSFDKSVRPWQGPGSLPTVLRNAIDQAQRTAVFNTLATVPLPAKRWAVASRWANEDNNLVPTLLAWDPEEGKLDDDEYQSLAKLLHRADVEGTLKGLGHVEAVQTLNVPEPSRRIPGDLWLRVGERLIEPGFAAVLGPIGIHPLRRRDDLDRVRRIRELSLDIAVASLSSRYARMFVGGSDSFDEGELGLAHKAALDSDERFAQRDGLTVAWPAQDQDIAFVDD